MTLLTEEDANGRSVKPDVDRLMLYERVIGASLTDRSMREAMYASWGLCGRHASGLLLAPVRGDDRQGYLTALLYVDLLERGLSALTVGGFLSGLRARSRLRLRGPCPMCASSSERDTASASLTPAAADASSSRLAPTETGGDWLTFACPACLGIHGGMLCREHLRAALPGVRLSEARASLGALTRRTIAYSRSFREGGTGRPISNDRASLAAAFGWCAGWREIAFALDLPRAQTRT